MERFSLSLMVLMACVTRAACVRHKRAAGAENIPLTDAQKLEIVKIHNDLRRSSGASDMRYMTWDSELEFLAENYGKQCHYKHNKQRKHSRYPSVGENIYASNVKLSDFVVTRPVQLWYDEISDFDFATRTCTPGKPCGHYTQVVWATSFKVGCSLTVCDYLSEISLSNALLYVCNYATTGNIVSGRTNKLLPIFKRGRACSECDEGDYCRNSLCANSARDFIDEPEKPDDSTGRTILGLSITVGVLFFIVVFLIAFIIYRERSKSTFKRGERERPAHYTPTYSKPTDARSYEVDPVKDPDIASKLLPNVKQEDIHSVTEETSAREPPPVVPQIAHKKTIPPPPKVPPPQPPPLPVKR